RPLSSSLSLHDALPILSCLCPHPRRVLSEVYLPPFERSRDEVAHWAVSTSAASIRTLTLISRLLLGMSEFSSLRRRLLCAHGLLDRKSTRLNSSHQIIS